MTEHVTKSSSSNDGSTPTLEHEAEGSPLIGSEHDFDEINSSRVLDIDPDEISEHEQTCINNLLSSETHWSTKLDCLQEIDDVLTSGKLSKKKAISISSSIVEPLSQMLSDLRSSIVKASSDVLVSVAKLLKEDFQAHNNLILKPLMKSSFSIIESIATSCRICLEDIVNIPGAIHEKSYKLFEEFLEDVVYQGNANTKLTALNIITSLHKQGENIFNKEAILKSLKKLKRDENKDILTSVEDVETLFNEEKTEMTILVNEDIARSLRSSLEEIDTSFTQQRSPSVDTSLQFSPLESYMHHITPLYIDSSTRVNTEMTLVEKKDGSTSPKEKVVYTIEDLEKAKNDSVQKILTEMSILSADYDDMEVRLNNEIRKRRELESFVQNYEKEFKNLSLKNGDDKEKESIKVQYTQLLIDYSKIESSFKELKLRYYEMKNINEKYKQNESIMKEKLQSSAKECKIFEAKYVKLKEHAEEQLNNANIKLKEFAAVKSHHEHTISTLEQEVTKVKREKDEKDLLIENLNDKIKKLSLVPKTQIKAMEDKIKNLEITNEQLVSDIAESQRRAITTETELRKQKEDNQSLASRSEELQQSLHVFYEENQKLKAKIYDKTNEIEALKSLISSSKPSSTPSSSTELEEKLKKEEERRQQLESRLKAKEKENKELLDICNQLIAKIERKPEE
ncbi:hypothetical protein C9374_003147 [Naegleria lovaniensis]|uniref:Transforming acidic coiled-coil-containing protein C-terminal domain-containing protein n=1 Tax=Naegleria lovaniensis TaxID=51637 RepID=A0AA88GTI2_NAELO|nr:uncharacterized protein C9374_003147 [Naegleria lovaniensis]KAG2385998.1 hypothetical protein C9374_003147 [Naegleria lovaniensis]